MNLEYKTSIIFSNSSGARCKVSDSALYLMSKFVQAGSACPESGGILLGRYLLNSEDVVIDSITQPMKHDSWSRFRFFRSPYGHQAIADEEWHCSSGTTNYLGEWHTHPQPIPLPSDVDLKSWRKLLKKSKFDSDFLFFIIVGTHEISAWQGYKNSLKIEKLVPVKV